MSKNYKQIINKKYYQICFMIFVHLFILRNHIKFNKMT